MSLKIAQTVSRTWYNLDPSLWSVIPEQVTFHPDGRGIISSRYKIFSRDGDRSKVLSKDFKWRLARDGPLGMEGIDDYALFDVIPKLIRSSEAWSRRTWLGGFVPAYIHLDLVGTSSFESDNLPAISDPFTLTPDSSAATHFPPELLEYIFMLASKEDTAAKELTQVCRRAREMVMMRRRREMFSILAQRFATNGIALWINCGHFNQISDHSPPTSFYGMQAKFFKYPPPCGYPEPQGQEWQNGWTPDRMYHSCKLPLPEKENPSLWRRLHGDQVYDAHPEVEKIWT